MHTYVVKNSDGTVIAEFKSDTVIPPGTYYGVELKTP